MKKLLTVLVTLLLVFTLAGCKKEVDYGKKSEGVMTYAEFMAAEVGAEVTIECYVQGHQSWWDNKITVYGADLDGGYFMYEMACSKEDAEKLTDGVKIKVHGYKAEYAGEIEIGSGATFEFVDDLKYVAEAEDVTALVGTNDLINKMNKKVSITGVVEDYGNGSGFGYKSSKGDDLYFNVNVNGNVVSFCVESYLTGSDTDVYKTVEGLKAGETVTVECFLYWWKGANPHVIGVTLK